MGEVKVARESSAKALNSVRSSRKAKVPKSDTHFYDDSFVTVYNERGQVVEREMWDYSVYRGEPMTWNEKDKNYDLRNGYKLVVKN